MNTKTQAKSNGTNVRPVGNRDAEAKAFAARAAKSEEFNADTSEFLDSKAVVNRGPLWIMIDLRLAYGDDMNMFPYPDSKVTDPKHGNNPAKFPIPTKNAATGATTTGEGDFYKSFCAALPKMLEIQHDLDQIAKAKADAVDTEAAFKTMNVVNRADLYANRTAQKSALISLVKRAVQLHFQLIEAEALQKCKVTLKKDGDGNIASTTKPVIITNTDDPTDWSQVSIPSFLNLNVDEAIKNGGTREALMNTAGRAAKKGQGGIGTEEKLPDVKGAEGMFAMLAHFFEDSTAKAKFMKRMNEDDAADLRETIFELSDVFDDLTTKFRDKFERDQINAAMVSGEGKAAEATA